MNKKEFSKALELAKTHSYGIANTGIFLGFGLKEFKQVACTINDIAGLIAYQCFCFNGAIDNDALNEIWVNRSKFVIV
jgi:hypothetical protein